MAKGKADYDELEHIVEDTRARVARVMGVPSDDVAYTRNTTHAIATVANGLDLQPGDRVVIPGRDFQSLVFPWLALRERGIIVDVATPADPDCGVTVDDFARVISSGAPPRVVAASWVHFGRGSRVDLAALARVAHDAGGLFCADVIQGLGLIPAHLAAWDVDFAAGGSQKWLLGAEGLGLLYVAERTREQLRPLEPGWASVAHRYDYDDLDLVWDDSARRYEGGAFNFAGTAALQASITMIEEAGSEAIWQHVDALCDRLVNGLARLPGARVRSDRTPERRSGIVSFALEDIDSADLSERLLARGFMCSPRSGGVRVAPHGYNTDDEIDALLAAAADEQDRQTERH